MKGKKDHIEPSPLTYDKKGLSKPKFFLTLFLTVVISASLVVGGTMSYFSLRSNYFITVDGKEVITPEIAEAIQTQINAAVLSPQQKLSQVMQALGPRQESLMWLSYAKKNGLSFQASDLVDALKQIYEEEKNTYQKENKNYYNIPYVTFVKQNIDIFNVQTIFGGLTIPSNPDYYNVAIEYSADKTQSIVDYKSIDLKDFIIKTKQKELEDFYQKSNNKVIKGKILKVLTFDSIEEAEKLSKELQKDSAAAKAKFSTTNQKLTIEDTAPETYIFVQNVNINETTPAFTYKNKNYVGLVESNELVDFKSLKDKNLSSVAKQYEASLSKKELDSLNKQIDNFLSTGAKQSFIKEGTTEPISISKSQDARDKKTLSPLDFGSVNNLEFFTQAFNQQGYISPVLNYMDSHYIIHVVKRIDPLFPIPKADYEKIQSTLKQREENMWFLYHRDKMKKDVDIEVNMKNINQLLSLGVK